jgi:hypothetical protein
VRVRSVRPLATSQTSMLCSLPAEASKCLSGENVTE